MVPGLAGICCHVGESNLEQLLMREMGSNHGWERERGVALNSTRSKLHGYGEARVGTPRSLYASENRQAKDSKSRKKGGKAAALFSHGVTTADKFLFSSKCEAV